MQKITVQRNPKTMELKQLPRHFGIPSDNRGYIDVGDGCWRPNVWVTKKKSPT